jgi:uncharacterized protein YndB with AHSA1/START domain
MTEAIQVPTSDYAVRTGPEVVRLERDLPGPVERVWAYLVDPEKRKLWFADGPMELREGGAVHLIWRNSQLTPNDVPPPEQYAKHGGESRASGTMTAYDPPHRISFTWAHPGDPETEATFELEPNGDRVTMVVTHRRLVTDGLVLGVSAGWHSHLAILEAKLAEREPPKFWAMLGKLRETYRQRYGM